MVEKPAGDNFVIVLSATGFKPWASGFLLIIQAPPFPQKNDFMS